jgi:hypothetical protein
MFLRERSSSFIIVKAIMYKKYIPCISILPKNEIKKVRIKDII